MDAWLFRGAIPLPSTQHIEETVLSAMKFRPNDREALLLVTRLLLLRVWVSVRLAEAAGNFVWEDPAASVRAEETASDERAFDEVSM
jgi:hypothetical protein